MQSRAEQVKAGKHRKQSKAKQSTAEQNSAHQKKQSRTDALKIPNKSVTKVWELEKQDKRNGSHIDRTPRVTQPLSTPRGPRGPQKLSRKRSAPHPITEPRTTTILCNLIAVRTLASEHVVDRKGAMSDSYEIQERRSETVLSSSEGPFFEREHFSGAHKVALQH